jgi:hypothetical protein
MRPSSVRLMLDGVSAEDGPAIASRRVAAEKAMAVSAAPSSYAPPAWARPSWLRRPHSRCEGPGRPSLDTDTWPTGSALSHIRAYIRRKACSQSSSLVSPKTSSTRARASVQVGGMGRMHLCGGHYRAVCSYPGDLTGSSRCRQGISHVGIPDRDQG